jgi:hypothetical protein
MLNNIFLKTVPFGDNVGKYGTSNVGKYGTSRQNTDNNTIRCSLQTHTQNSYVIRNRFSKAKWLRERA